MNKLSPDMNDLLAAARIDLPPPEAKARIRDAIEQKLTETPEAIELVPETASTAASKLIGVGLVSGLVLLAGVFLARQPSVPTDDFVPKSKAPIATPKSAPIEVSAPPKNRAPNSKTEKAPAQAKQVLKSPSTPTMPRKNAATVTPKPIVKPVKSPVPKPSQLSLELKLISQGENALHAGKHEDALRLLQSHETQFSEGILADERQLLRVLVFCDQNRYTSALKIARTLMKSNPNSKVRDRIADTCAKMALEMK